MGAPQAEALRLIPVAPYAQNDPLSVRSNKYKFIIRRLLSPLASIPLRLASSAGTRWDTLGHAGAFLMRMRLR